MISQFVLTFFLLNLIRRALLAFHPSLSTIDWCISALHSTNVRKCSCSIKHLVEHKWIAPWLMLLSLSYIVNQTLQGLLPLSLIVVATFIAVLLLHACIDWFYFLLPNILTLILMVVGFYASTYLFHADLTNVLLRCGLSYSVLWALQSLYHLLRHKVGLGSGDVKLITALACWFDIQQLSLIVLLASITALPFCLVRCRNINSLDAIIVPFGTFLSLSAVFCAYFFYNEFLTTMYFQSNGL